MIENKPSLVAITPIALLLCLSLFSLRGTAQSTRFDCVSSSSDSDGDGFGWENGRTCLVVSGALFPGQASNRRPDCVGAMADTDGDGFGWENGVTCIASPTRSAKPACQLANSDPDGDGFGWEKGKSCVAGSVASSIPGPDGAEETVTIKFPSCSQSRYDPDGDGFGWENSRTCSSLNVGDGGRSITDIVLVTGQSNALGAESVLDAEVFDAALDSPVRRAYAYTNTGWSVAGLRQIWDQNWHPRGHIERQPANNFAFHFAKNVVRMDEDRVVGFILITAPGADIAHWDRGGPFFSAIRNKVSQALDALPGTAKVSAILWHQGESDYSDTPYYSDKLNALIGNFRREFWFDDRGLFICGETLNAPLNTRLLALNNNGDARTGCVSSTGLTSVGDDIHFSANSLRVIGRRYASKFLDLLK